MNSETVIILVAVVVSIVAGMFSRLAGRVAGVLLIGGLMGWGAHIYGQGRALSFFGSRLSQGAFFGILGALAAYEVVALLLAIRARRRERASIHACPACGALETTTDSEGRNSCQRCQHSWS